MSLDGRHALPFLDTIGSPGGTTSVLPDFRDAILAIRSARRAREAGVVLMLSRMTCDLPHAFFFATRDGRILGVGLESERAALDTVAMEASALGAADPCRPSPAPSV